MLKKFLNKDQLYKNVFTLVKGTVAAQAITMLAQPVLRRVFSAEDFGLFAIYIAAVSILVVISTARYEMAIVLPKDDGDAQKLFNISVKIAIFFNVLVFIAIFLSGHQIIDLCIRNGLVVQASSSEIWKLYAVLYLIPVGVFLLSLFNTLQFFFTRHKKYSSIVSSRVTNAGSNVLSAGAFGFSGSGFIGIFIGYIIGLFSSIILLFIKKRKEPKLESSKTQKELLKEYIDFPTKSLGAGFLNILATQLPLILIGSFFGLAILGLYELIVRVLNIPITMIGKSVSQVFFQKISEDVNNNKPIGNYVRSFSMKLFLLMLIPMTVVFFFGAPLFEFAFGEEYYLSGELAGYFAVFYLIRFVYYSQSNLYAVKRKINIELYQNLIYLISQIGALIVGYYYFGDFRTTFILLACSGFACYLFFTINLLKVAQSDE